MSYASNMNILKAIKDRLAAQLYKIETIEIAYSAGGGADYLATGNAPIINGFNPVGIIGFNTTYQSAPYCTRQNHATVYLSGRTVTVQGNNQGAGQFNGRVKVDILYLPTNVGGGSA